MADVVIVGAGPAGAIAGDRARARGRGACASSIAATFPRDKLCGDTVNPGTLERLRRLGVDGDLDARGCVSTACWSPASAATSSTAATRADSRGARSCGAISTGCCSSRRSPPGVQYEAGVAVRRATVDESRRCRSCHRRSRRRGDGHERVLRGRVVVAADGRHSTIAFGLGLARHPARPRRWADGRLLRERVTHDQRAPDSRGTSIRRARICATVSRRDARAQRLLHRRRAGAGRPDERVSGAAVGSRRHGARGSCGAADARACRRSAASRSLCGCAARGAARGPRSAGGGVSAHGDRRAAALPGDAAGIHRSDDRRRSALRGPAAASLPPRRRCRRSSMDGPASMRGSRPIDGARFASKWRFNRALRALVVVGPRH